MANYDDTNLEIYVALCSAVNPCGMTRHEEEMVARSAACMGPEARRVFGVIGGALAASIGLDQRVIDEGPCSGQAGWQSCHEIWLNMKQGMELKIQSAGLYIDGLGLSPELNCMYKDTMRLFYEMQLDVRKMGAYTDAVCRALSAEKSRE